MKDYTKIDDERILPENLEIINKYLPHLKARNKSLYTIKEYSLQLKSFFAKVNKPLNQMEPEEFHNWIEEMELKYKSATIRTKFARMSAFLKFCSKMEFIDKTFLKSRWKPSLNKPIPKFLDNSEITKTKIASDDMELRNRCIFHLLLSSGARVGEIHLLNANEIDLDNQTTEVLGKGVKKRNIRFSDTCSILLERYLENHPGGENPLFLSRENNRLSIRMIQRIIKVLGKKAELEKGVSPHCLRHTYASHLLYCGVDITDIKEDLGHSNLDTTRVYANLPKEEVIAMYRKIMEG